ncbi:MAG: zinc-ribbon domain-containing protein [Candidatus Lokiarchaeota archaeon]|nr:zinc-ribbon domain-containing protein [Candidatus Lokiarchaeota archaeon]
MSPYCTNCGSEIEDSWNACPNCGRVLRESQIPQQQSIPQTQLQPQRAPQPYRVQPYQRSYSSGNGNVYGIVALVCGLIGLFGAVLYFGIVLGIVAIAMGGIGLSRDDNNSMAVIGLILGIIDFVCCFVVFFLLFTWLAWFPFGFFY